MSKPIIQAGNQTTVTTAAVTSAVIGVVLYGAVTYAGIVEPPLEVVQMVNTVALGVVLYFKS